MEGLTQEESLMNEQTALLTEVKLIPPDCSARTPSGAAVADKSK